MLFAGRHVGWWLEVLVSTSIATQLIGLSFLAALTVIVAYSWRGSIKRQPHEENHQEQIRPAALCEQPRSDGSMYNAKQGHSITDAAAWWQLPPASAAESAIIESLRPASAVERMSLLRQLRALGPNVTSAELADRQKEVYEWRTTHLSTAARSANASCQSSSHWPSAVEIEHGSWALEYIALGIRCGRARGGHPVKVERIGHAQTERLEAETGEAGGVCVALEPRPAAVTRTPCSCRAALTLP